MSLSRAPGSIDNSKEIEILVLRQQLAVLRRRTPRLRMSWTDRALTRLVPTRRRVGVFVTPATILRWHDSSSVSSSGSGCGCGGNYTRVISFQETGPGGGRRRHRVLESAALGRNDPSAR